MAFLMAFPMAALAQVNVRVDIAAPAPILFAGPPELVVIPGTYVYVVPDLAEDLYFYNGWWWRFWNGRWFRSRYYDSGWIYYDRVPVFYSQVSPYWRNYYHEHRWKGREWNYQRIPYEHLQRNWGGWERSKYWEYQQSWGVRGFQPHPATANIQPPPPPPPANKAVNRDFRPPNELKPMVGSPPLDEARVIKRREKEMEAQRYRELPREKQLTAVEKPGPAPRDIKVQRKFEKEGDPVHLKPAYRDAPPPKVERREIREAHAVKPPPKPVPHEVKVEHKQ
jgi:hypothetical protein